MVTWGRKSCLGPAEISSCVQLFDFKDRGRWVSQRFHLFVADVNQRSKDFPCRDLACTEAC